MLLDWRTYYLTANYGLGNEGHTAYITILFPPLRLDVVDFRLMIGQYDPLVAIASDRGCHYCRQYFVGCYARKASSYMKYHVNA